jgi:hypothetical protein
MDAAHAHSADHDHGHHHPKGLMRWITTTNHKDIGSLYLWFSFIMFLSGGVLALLIRSELFMPGMQIVKPEVFNQLTTLHGLIMVFGAIMPAFVGFANWQIPMMIGAPDMAFARMNNWSFWLLPPAAILLMSSFLVPGGAASAGWTLYAPNDFCGPYHGRIIDYGFNQHHHNHFEYARTWHDINEDAVVRLDLVDYRLFIDCCDAGSRRCSDHVIDRSSFRH